MSKVNMRSVADAGWARLSSRLLTLSLLLLFSSLLGCAPKPTVPTAPVRATLGPSDEPPSVRAAALEVAFAGPIGEATAAAEIVVMFNKPMRSLEATPASPPPPIRIEPPVEGTWQWVGSRALRFAPASGLPRATKFVVEVPAGIPARDTTTLSDAFAFEFVTARPRLTAQIPEDGDHHVDPARALSLRFDQPMDPSAVQTAITLRATLGFGRPAPSASGGLTFALTPDPDDPQQLFYIEPTNPLPASATVELRVSGQLVGRQGPMPMGEDVSIQFRTLGPLAVIAHGCVERNGLDNHQASPPPAASCDPDEGFQLTASNDVDSDILEGALAFTPAVDAWVAHRETTDEGRSVYEVRGEFEPGTRYRFSISPQHDGGPGKVPPSHADPSGPLRPYAGSITFGERSSDAHLVMRGTHWPAQQSLPIRVRAVNSGEIRLFVDAVDPTAAIVYAATGRLPEVGRGPLRKTFAAPSLNTRAQYEVALTDLNGAPTSGMIAVSLVPERTAPQPSATDDSKARSRATHVVQITDLSVFTQADANTVFAWVTHRLTGEVVSGATAALFDVDHPDAAVATGTTDADGLIRLTSTRDTKRRSAAGRPAATEAAIKRVLVVKYGDEVTYQAIELAPEPTPISVGFTDRGLYRPGETVNVKGIVRIPGLRDLETPSGLKVSITIEDPEGGESLRSVELNEFGTFATRIHLSASAKLGFYRVRSDLGRGQNLTGFRVAEYQPAAFEVDARIDRATYQPGDRLTCTASARYFHGGPLAGGRMRLGLYRYATSFTPPHWEKFSFETPRAAPSSHLIEPVYAELDRQGTYRVTEPLTLPDQTGPESVSCRVSASDFDQASYVAGASALVHFSDRHVGLRVDRSVSSGSAFAVEVIATDHEGRATSDDVQVTSWLQERNTYDGPVRRTMLEQCVAKVRRSAAKCSFSAPALEYAYDTRELVVQARLIDRNRRVVQAETSVVPYAPPTAEVVPPTPAPSPGPEPEPRLELSLEAPRAEIGDRLRVGLTSPFDRPSPMLVTLSRESIFSRTLLRLPPGKSSMTLPISAAMAPNVDVSILAVQGDEHQTTGTSLLVKGRDRELRVELVPSAKEAAPGQEIDLEVRVTDANGKPVKAEIALWGADLGTLSLAQYRSPDPYETFAEDRRGSLTRSHTRDDALTVTWWGSHRTRAPRVRMGATKLNRRGLREDFRQTVVFEPSLSTDAHGRLRHRVKLPDGMTTYRFFAVAVTETNFFGVAEADVQTQKPLMVEPGLPRVVRVGDRFGAVATLIAKRDGDVSVSIEATGISVVGPSTKQTRLSAEMPKPIQFDLRADRAGPYSIKMSTVSNRDTKRFDTVVLKGTVTVPMLEESSIVFGDVNEPVAEGLGDLTRVRPDVGGLRIELSNSRFVGLRAGIEQLLEYPYGCTEQTASRMIPLVALSGLSQSLGVTLPERVDEELEQGVQRILSSQHADGGFGLWPNSRASSPWLSAYALQALFQAEGAGASVDPRSLARGRAYIQTALDDLIAPERPDRSDLVRAASLLDVLAETGAVNTEQVQRLLQHQSSMPVSAKAQLLYAAHTGGLDLGDHRDEMLRTVLAGIHLDGDSAHVTEPSTSTTLTGAALALDLPIARSQTTVDAMVLRALLAVEPKHPVVAPLAKGLMNARTKGTWTTTHETAWALRALEALRLSLPTIAGDTSGQVYFGRELVVDRRFEANVASTTSTYVPMSRLRTIADGDNRLTFAREGPATLHYQARLRYALKEMPTTARDEGFTVERTLTRVRGIRGLAGSAPGTSADASDTVTLGDLVVVDLTVATPNPRMFVVIDDPLPGGIFAIDPSLGEDTEEERAPIAWNYERRELRDDRVLFFVDRMNAGVHHYRYYARAATPGTFVGLPAQVFEMYAPETRGRTSAPRLVVTKP